MLITQIPGRYFATEHIPVIFFCVANHQRILFGEEIRVRSDLSIALQIIHRFATELCQFTHYGRFTCGRYSESGSVTIGFNPLPELLKAASKVNHNWWTIDLCFWSDAWAATAQCKKALDGYIAKYGA